MTKEEKLDNPKVKIVEDKEGIPCIDLTPNISLPRFFEVHFFEFTPKRPKDFTELQKEKQQTFLEKALKELEDMFKGWF